MKRNKCLYIVSLLLLVQNGQIIPAPVQKAAPAQKAATTQTTGGYSQTESYLKALAPTRQAAYAKIKEVLQAPQVDKWGGYDKVNPKIVQINPQAFEPIINQAIDTEKKHPGYYAFYHGSQKEGFLTHLIRTYMNQIEHGWARDDFFMLRASNSFYKKQAKSALDYMNQNMPSILQQFIPAAGSKHPNCILEAEDLPGIGYKCTQFDLGGDWRNQLISTSPAMVAGVDDTSQELRRMTEQDWAAWESSFYYFAQGLTWSNVLKLYGRLITELKEYSPDLFKNTPISISLRKYIAFKFSMVAELLFPHPRQKMVIKASDTFEIYSNAGMMFQFLIPANIVDDVAYLAWANGILWQRKIGGFDGGWDNSLGAYVKLSPILDRMKTNPQLLGRAINLFQTRIIYKDERYFNDPKSPVKINLIHSLPQTLFKSIEDALRSIARVIVENKKEAQKGTQAKWFEQTDIANTVKMDESKLATLLASKKEEDQVKALNIVYYLVATDVDRDKNKQIAGQFKNSGNAELKKLSEEIGKL